MNLFKWKNNAYFHSISWSFCSILLNFFKQLMLVPIYISFLGKEEFGIWLILLSIVNLIRGINVGQTNYSSNLINLNYSKGDGSLLNKLVSYGHSANIIMVVFQIIIVICISIPFVLNGITGISLSFIKNSNLSLSLLLLLIPTIIYQYATLFLLRLFEPAGKIHISIKYSFLGELVDMIGTILFIFLFKSILGMSFGIFLFNSLYSIFLIWFVKRQVHFLNHDSFKFSLNKGLSQIVKSLLLTFSFIVEKINELGLNIVVGRLFLPINVPLFSASKTITNIALKVSSALVGPLMPSVQNNFATDNHQSNNQLIVKFWKFTSNILLLGVVGFYPIIPFLFEKWTLGKISYNGTLIVCFLMSILFQNFSSILVECLRKLNLIKEITGYNLLKVGVIIALFIVGGILKDFNFVGYAILIAEVLSTLYLYFIRRSYFADASLSRVFKWRMLINLIFSTLFIMYSFNLINYIYVIIGVIALVIVDFMKSKKNENTI